MQFGENLNEEADEEMDVSDNDDDFGGPRKKCRNEKDVEIGLLKVLFFSKSSSVGLVKFCHLRVMKIKFSGRERKLEMSAGSI